MIDDDEPARKVPHEVGMVLDTLSVAELRERIGLLEAEILRLKSTIDSKEASRSAAESVFKL